ncbi:MAG: DEAD/DEAH box helicase [Thermoplasmata archaeon]|nr:DEAD/DEAH box helicase [Thermoplasmata archaeon]
MEPNVGRPPKGPIPTATAHGSGSPSDRVAISELPIDPDLAGLLRAQGIEAFYPPQAEALGPALAGESVLLACPTASGKSLVAYLALLRAVRAGRTGLYLVPLRALAHEKHEELSAFAALGVRAGISIGDYDLPAEKLEKLDVLVATSEKADALLRKGSPWLDRLGVVVADEVHLMRDADRGPTLEVSLTRLMRAHPGLQVVALSATVGNSKEIAEWLKARHITSDFRPVPLKVGVHLEGRITFTDLSVRTVNGRGEPLPRLVRDVLEEGGQALVFVNTRKASEQVAQSLVATVRSSMTGTERAIARRLADELPSVEEEQTEGVRRLSGLLPNGVAYHNASLTNAERRVVERAFKDRTLKALVATPTLAAGINLPARRVIIRDTTRYDDRVGMQAPIPAMDIQQMCGRAGRPRFDSAGEAVVLARDASEAQRLLDEVLASPPEAVRSRLAAEPALRMHVLALVASGEVASEAELESFFAATFYGHTLPLEVLTETVRAVRGFLESGDFLRPGPALEATPFGHLTSELYLDPVSALVLRSALGRAPIGVRAFPLLAAIAATPDLPPVFLRRGDEPDLLARFADNEAELLVKPEEEPLNLELENFLSTLKTATILEAWTEETPIVELTERFSIGAGDLRAKVEDADWLLFGASRLAQRFQRRVARPIDALSLRVRYGVKEELIDLVRLRGIGRVRARRLFRAGFSDRDSLRGASLERVERALGSRSLAEQLLRQLESPGSPRPPQEATARSEATGSPTTASGPRSAAKGSRTLEEFPDYPEP